MGEDDKPEPVPLKERLWALVAAAAEVLRTAGEFRRALVALWAAVKDVRG
jgi:hypothetical protein